MTSTARTHTLGTAGTRVHACVFFDDDDGFELVCGCGERALRLLDEHGDSALVVLYEEPSPVAAFPEARAADLAVSA